MKQLGFGMMRLPLKDPKEQTQVDRAQAQVMVDAFLESGFTYVDTAYFYHGGESERVVKDILTSRYPRERYLLADKMPLANLKVKGTVEKQAAIFDEQLEKCGTAYFDRYLLHCLNAENYQIAQRLDTFSFLMKKKEEGKLRHLGFSFHDKAELLDQILTEHPETEFVQLQINYLDWDDERIQSRKCYETAVRHGKKVVVMEPVKGGRLAKLPAEAEKLLREVHPDWSPASWAIRFAASLPEVEIVLSGMSDMAQVADNTCFMADFQPLTEEETALLAKVAEILSALPAVECTACRYCVAGCPRDIPIPDYFALYNGDQMALRQGLPVRKADYERLAASGGKASACVSCRQCEQACPQHLKVVDHLARVAKTYEG